jgi:hypothetical protein
MLIRPYRSDDLKALERIHENNELPTVCLPDPTNPLFFVGQVVEHEGKTALAAFLKLTAEPYLLVDKTVETPEWRWDALRALNETISTAAWLRGLEQLSAWIPPEIEPSFKKRLQQMGYKKSPWSCYTNNLEQ